MIPLLSLDSLLHLGWSGRPVVAEAPDLSICLERKRRFDPLLQVGGRRTLEIGGFGGRRKEDDRKTGYLIRGKKDGNKMLSSQADVVRLRGIKLLARGQVEYETLHGKERKEGRSVRGLYGDSVTCVPSRKAAEPRSGDLVDAC